MRMTLALAAACLIIGMSVAAESVASAKRYDLNIPRQPLDTALKDLAQQTGLQIARFSDTIDGSAAAGPVIGMFTTQEALQNLLSAQGLTYKIVNDRTIAIIKAGSAKANTLQDAGAPSTGVSSAEPVLRVAQNTPAETTQPSSKAAPDSSSRPNDKLAEIVVTAQKRTERLQDVPIPVTVLSGETLVNNNQLRLQDWYTSVPGFVVSPAAVAGAQILSLRGISTGIGNPTVGIAIDGIPYGSSTLLGGLAVPDIDPGDLARIEVLRGPQGTLYGENSLGGLINFITVDPSTEGFNARVQAGLSSVKNGSGLGYNARGSVNMPLDDTLAMRLSAFTNEDPGYIDNSVRHIDGINKLTTDGGRFGLLWQPSDTFSLKLGALDQKAEAEGLSVVHGPGDLQQDFILGTPFWKEVQNYSAILTAKLGVATLTSLTGYNIESFESTIDASNSGTGQLMQVLYGPLALGGAQINESKTKKISQELRLSIPLADNLNAMVGGYWSQEDTLWNVDFAAENPATQQILDYFVQSRIPTYNKEIAGFANLTYQITSQFDVQVGGRYTKFSGDSSETDVGTFYNEFVHGAAVNSVTASLSNIDAHKFTYLLTPRFKITPDVMVYARFASGYSTGGGNIGVVAPAPSNFKPQETQNYELGFKADFLDHTLSFDVSTYYIDWKDIQLFLTDPVSQQNFLGNGGKAKSQGLELSVQSKPLRGLKLSGWIAWDNAELTENLPATSLSVGHDGDPLPYSARFTGNLAVEQSFPLMSDMNGLVGADATYMDKRLVEFSFLGAGPRQSLPGYAQTNFHAGVQYGSWTGNLFVNNVADRRGMLSRTGVDNDYIIYNQPRTVGLSVTKTF